MVNVPPGYVRACWIVTSSDGFAEAVWLYRHEGRWRMREVTLVSVELRGQEIPDLDLPLKVEVKRAEALRVTDDAVQTMLSLIAAKGHTALGCRVDLGTADRVRLHTKIARSPVAGAARLAEYLNQHPNGT